MLRSRRPSPSSNKAPLTTLLLLSFLYLLALSTTAGFLLIYSRSRSRSRSRCRLSRGSRARLGLLSCSLRPLSFRRFNFASESADNGAELDCDDDGAWSLSFLLGLLLRGLR
jgi:hypothetical protein